MVKVDPQRDYYADLELSSTADAEEIKKQFRALAKQYHPDRNPGRETEVVAKFQAVQAAHEILSDIQQKAKYDEGRAKLNKANNFNSAFNDIDPYAFRKPVPKTTKPNTKTPFSAPPRPRPGRFSNDTPSGRGKPPTTSSGAEKLNAFTRPTQQWDRAKFDEAARADAARGFASMRSTQATPQPPPRPPRHPTAPRPFSNDPSPDVPPPQTGPSPGFPGMSRTAGVRPGFAPATPGGDEPMAPRTSAYAHTRDQRPHSAYFPDSSGSHSPTMPKQKPPVNPLRQVRSSVFDDSRPQRPTLGREPSKYATSGGERTNISGPGMGRSTSVRNSPVEKPWDENGQNGWSRPHSHHEPAPTRHRSESPKTRKAGIQVEISSSESSSSEDELPTMKSSRQKAQTRRPQSDSQTKSDGPGYRSFQKDNPALTGQIPNTNYTKIVEGEASQYHYPPPGPPNGPIRRPFPNLMPTGPDGYPGANGGGGGMRRSETWAPKYDPFHSYSRTWSKHWGFPSSKSSASGSCLNGVPSWAVPSSVFPGPRRSSRTVLEPIVEDTFLNSDEWNDHSFPVPIPDFHLRTLKADLRTNTSSATTHEGPYNSHGSHDPNNVSQENITPTFSAADWDGKFTSGDEFFQPLGGSRSRERTSPSRITRTRTRSLGKEHGMPQAKEQDINDSTEDSAATAHTGSGVGEGTTDAQSDASKAAAFQQGKFSAEEWAERLKDQKWSIPNTELLNANRSKTTKRGSKLNTTKRPPAVPQTSAPLSEDDSGQHTTSTNGVSSYFIDDPDAMDIDDNSPVPAPQATSTNGSSTGPENVLAQASYGPPTADGLDLHELTKAAPFVPSATGLRDLDDLASTLPFESRAARAVNVERPPPSFIRRLDLPRPPKTIDPPLTDHISQERWEGYVNDMNRYMHDWNVFNSKMIDHFRFRQDQIKDGMGRNWISSVGDGPPAQTFHYEAAVLGAPKPGYATYMTWLDEDAKCRAWWEEANERHRVCFEELGKVREEVKRVAV